jgi:hypothetical protein
MNQDGGSRAGESVRFSKSRERPLQPASSQECGRNSRKSSHQNLAVRSGCNSGSSLPSFSSLSGRNQIQRQTNGCIGSVPGQLGRR